MESNKQSLVKPIANIVLGGAEIIRLCNEYAESDESIQAKDRFIGGILKLVSGS